MVDKLNSRRSNLVIRDMVSENLAEVLVIERNAQVSPWSRLSFEEALTRSEQGADTPYCCRVIDFEGQILGYHVVSWVADELHVLNVVVATLFQGQGLGHMLMRDIEQLAHTRHLKKSFLEVRASNLTAQGLYTKWQYQQIAVRKAYYSGISSGINSDISAHAMDGVGKGERIGESDAINEQAQREDALIFMRRL